MSDKPNLIRLSKLMAERGLCSRREADQLIEKGWVRVDGHVIHQLGSKVDETCRIEIEKKGQQVLKEKVTIIINKPVGFVSSQPEKNYRAAVELIVPQNQWEKDRRKLQPRDTWGLAPAGRLDIDSRGLLILTQDGVLVRSIIGPESEMEKEYHVRVEGKINDEKLRWLRSGLKIDGQPLKPAKVHVLSDQRLQFILREGKKRQIRRMCDLVDLKVTSLLRVRIGKLHLRDLPEGQWRFLKPSESI